MKITYFSKIRKFIVVLLLSVMFVNLLPASEINRSTSDTSEADFIYANADSNDRRKTWIQLSKGKQASEIDEIKDIGMEDLRVIATFLSNYYIPFSTVIAGTSVEFKKSDEEYDEEAMTQYQKDMAAALVDDVGFEKDTANYIVGLTVEACKNSCNQIFISEEAFLATINSTVWKLGKQEKGLDKTGILYAVGTTEIPKTSSGAGDGNAYYWKHKGGKEEEDTNNKDSWNDKSLYTEADLAELASCKDSTGHPYIDIQTVGQKNYVSLTYGVFLSYMALRLDNNLARTEGGEPKDNGLYWIDNGNLKKFTDMDSTFIYSWLLSNNELNYNQGQGSALFSVTDDVIDDKYGSVNDKDIPTYSMGLQKMYIDWVGDVVVHTGTGLVVALPGCYNPATFNIINQKDLSDLKATVKAYKDKMQQDASKDASKVQRLYTALDNRPMNIVNAYGIEYIRDGKINTSNVDELLNSINVAELHGEGYSNKSGETLYSEKEIAQLVEKSWKSLSDQEKGTTWGTFEKYKEDWIKKNTIKQNGKVAVYSKSNNNFSIVVNPSSIHRFEGKNLNNLGSYTIADFKVDGLNNFTDNTGTKYDKDTKLGDMPADTMIQFLVCMTNGTASAVSNRSYIEIPEQGDKFSCMMILATGSQGSQGQVLHNHYLVELEFTKKNNNKLTKSQVILSLGNNTTITGAGREAPITKVDAFGETFVMTKGDCDTTFEEALIKSAAERGSAEWDLVKKAIERGMRYQLFATDTDDYAKVFMKNGFKIYFCTEVANKKCVIPLDSKDNNYNVTFTNTETNHTVVEAHILDETLSGNTYKLKDTDAVGNVVSIDENLLKSLHLISIKYSTDDYTLASSSYTSAPVAYKSLSLQTGKDGYDPTFARAKFNWCLYPGTSDTDWDDASFPFTNGVTKTRQQFAEANDKYTNYMTIFEADDNDMKWGEGNGDIGDAVGFQKFKHSTVSKNDASLVVSDIIYYDDFEEITKETELSDLFKRVDLYDLITGDEKEHGEVYQPNIQDKGYTGYNKANVSLVSGSNKKFACCLFYTYVFEYFNSTATAFDENVNIINAKLTFDSLPQVTGNIDWSFYTDTTGDEIMSFVYYLLHPTKGTGYVKTWFKNKVSGILLGWHEDIVGSTYSNATTGMTKYLGFTGYVTIPTLNDISWVSKLLANYNSIIIYLIIIMVVIMLCYVIIGSLTLQRGILGVIIFAVFALLPPLAINTVVDFTNQVNDRIYTAKFDYWALVQMQQYVMELDEAREAKASGDTSSYANFVISQYTNASSADSAGGASTTFYSGVKLKWMSPKKYAVVATLSDKMDSVNDNGATYLKNILLNSVANKVSGETYIDSNSALYLYRDYFDIYRYASCSYNADKMAGTGYRSIQDGKQNNVVNNWNTSSKKNYNFKYRNSDITLHELILANYEKSATDRSKINDKYGTSSLFAVRQGFLFNTAQIPMSETNSDYSKQHEFDSKTINQTPRTYYNDTSTKATSLLLNYTEAYEAVDTKAENFYSNRTTNYNSLTEADFYGIDAINFAKGIQEFTGGVKGNELSLFEDTKDYAYYYYGLYTESPFYFFSFNVQDQLNAAKNTYNWGSYKYDYNKLAGTTNGSIKALFLNENQAYFYNLTNFAGDGYGELRDFMNFHDLFYYVMPVLRQGTQLAKDFDNKFGLYTYDDCPLYFQSDGKFIYGGFADEKYDTWKDFVNSEAWKGLDMEAKSHFWHDYNVNTIFNAYSAWYDTMLDCNYSKSETKTIAGKKFTIEDPLDPTTYFKLDKNGKLVEGRFMIFSRSEMKFYGLTEADLTQVERKLIKVADEVYKESIDLMNYYTLADEVLIQAYAMNQLFAFNKEFSQTSLTAEDYVMYPQAYELKAFTYDAYLRLILSGSTGESLMTDSETEYLTDETEITSNQSLYGRIMKNTSIFFGIVMLINDFLAVYILPALKLFFLVLIFLSSVALIIASSVKLEQPVNAFWKCLLAPMLGFAAISIGMAWLVSKFMSEGAQGVVQTSELIVLGDPTMAIVVMTVVNVVALILYWKLLKKALGTFINYVKAIGASIGGAIAGVAGAIAGGLAGGGFHFDNSKRSKTVNRGGSAHHSSDAEVRGRENDPRNGKNGLTPMMTGAGVGLGLAAGAGAGGSGDGAGGSGGAGGSNYGGGSGGTNAYSEKAQTLKPKDEAMATTSKYDVKKKEAKIASEEAKDFKGSYGEQSKAIAEKKRAVQDARTQAIKIKGDKSFSEMSKEEREAYKQTILQQKRNKVAVKVGTQIRDLDASLQGENAIRMSRGQQKIDTTDKAVRNSIQNHRKKQEKKQKNLTTQGNRGNNAPVAKDAPVGSKGKPINPLPKQQIDNSRPSNPQTSARYENGGKGGRTRQVAKAKSQEHKHEKALSSGQAAHMNQDKKKK